MPFKPQFFPPKDKPETIASKRLLDMASVKQRKFVPKMNKLVIDFDVINDDKKS